MRDTGKLRKFAYPAYFEPTSECTQDTLKRTTLTTSRKFNINSITIIASKSVESAVNKYQQWSKKSPFSDGLRTEAESTKAKHASQSTETLSDYNNKHRLDDKVGLLDATHKKFKIYSCMRSFLMKKCSQQSQNCGTSITNEGSIADFNKTDRLDQECNTDSTFTCTCDKQNCNRRKTYRSKNTLKENRQCCNDSSSALLLKTQREKFFMSTSCCLSNSKEEEIHIGISDCSQLLNEKCTARRSLKKKMGSQERPNSQNVELLQASWYQPHLSSTAATKRLQLGTPGDFILRYGRRKYQLSLRLKTNVKHFAIIDCGNSFRFKDGQKQFSSLPILITHHSVMAEQLPMTLVLPRTGMGKVFLNSGTRHPEDFESFESLQFSGITNEMQAECPKVF